MSTWELVDTLVLGPMLGVPAGVWAAHGLHALAIIRAMPRRVDILTDTGEHYVAIQRRRWRRWALFNAWAHVLPMAWLVWRLVQDILGIFL